MGVKLEGGSHNHRMAFSAGRTFPLNFHGYNSENNSGNEKPDSCNYVPLSNFNFGSVSYYHNLFKMKIKTIKVGSLKTNCYIVHDQKRSIIIDPGAEPQKIIKKIEKIGLNPACIINTHTHFDHIGANKQLADKYNLDILQYLPDSYIINKIDYQLKAIRTPGHKEDCICLLANEVMFTGDTIFQNDHGRVDLPGGSKSEMRKSLKKLSTFVRAGTKIYPGHGNSFVLETENLIQKYLKHA